MAAPTESPTLRYDFGTCSLAGRPTLFLLAMTELGLCALLLDEPGHEAALAEDLENRFHTHRLVREPQPETLQQIQALLEGTRSTLDRPLAPEGTAFQRKVWQALQAVPAGTAVTYTQLAETLNLPAAAVRAVAGACAANPLAVAIPCHRVVRGDGSLAGYRWGLATKRALLQREADRAMTVSAFVLTS